LRDFVIVLANLNALRRPFLLSRKGKEKASMFNALQRAEHGVEEKEKVDLVHGGTARFATEQFKAKKGPG
jgi:hypothetical protein